MRTRARSRGNKSRAIRRGISRAAAGTQDQNRSGAQEKQPLLLLVLFRLAMLSALLVDDAGCDLFLAARITAFLLEFILDLFVLVFAFRADSGWHDNLLAVERVASMNQPAE